MAASGKLTATDANDLFTDIVSFLTGTPATAGRDWTIIKDWRTESVPENKIVLKNDGLPGGNDVYIGLYDKSKDGNKHVLFVKTYTYWDSSYDFWDTSFGSPLGYGDTRCCVPHWNASMDYWIYSNQKRVILVIKTQNRYGMCYLGSILSYLPSNEFPQPLACVADGYTHLTNWGYLDSYDAMLFTHPNGYQSYEQNYRQGFLWIDPHHSYVQYSTFYRYHGCNAVLTQANVWSPFFHTAPLRTGYLETDALQIYDNTAPYYGSLMGNVPVFFESGEPSVLVPAYVTILDNPNGGVNSDYRCLVGEWDGVYWVPNNQLTAESTIDTNYTVFPNIDRTTWLDWMAIKEE